MTTNERRFLVGFGILGLLTLAGSIALTMALLVANLTFQGQPKPSAVQTSSAPAAAFNQLVKNVTAPIEQTVREAAKPPVAPVAQAPAEPRLALPLAQAQVAGGADLAQLYTQVNPGVVSIEVDIVADSPFGQGSFSQHGSGSGFVYDDRHIVTNNHVAAGAKTVEVVFFDGERREGKVVGTDQFSDLAVIEIADMPSTARSLPLVANFSALKVGQPVVAIGNPFGKANSMTYGIISQLGRTIPDGQTQFSIPQTIQTDAAINPGNSGGPLLNLQGEVIGINAQIEVNPTNQLRSAIPGNSGVGFSIPASIVQLVVPTLSQGGSYEWSYLGVQGTAITLDLAKKNNLSSTKGAYVVDVVAQGPSDNVLKGATNLPQETAPQVQPNRGGPFIIPMQPGPGSQQADTVPQGGDVITAIDGQQVNSFDDLLSYISLQTRPGQKVSLTVLRGGQATQVEVTVQARPLRQQQQQQQQQ